MTSIRIAVVSALAVGALFAGSSHAQHAAPARASHVAVVRSFGGIGCCK